MAGELIVKNGLRVSGSVLATIGFTGSFSGSFSGSFAGSIATSTSASFSATASYINPLTQSVIIKGTGTTSATNALSIFNANASASLVVRDDGRVGLGGITSPSAVLDISGSLNIKGVGLYINSTQNYGAARLYTSYGYLSGEFYIIPSGSAPEAFVFSPNGGMTIGGFTIGGTSGSPPAYGLTVSGSVGIGTRVPTTQLDVSGSGRFTGNLTVTGSIIAASFTGSHQGTSSWATNALTASAVNTLSQNVVITGSLTVGAIAPGSGENTLIVGPPPNGGTGEGGQILLSATGGTYTSASMLDTYQNRFRVLRGTNASSDAFKLQIDLDTGQLQIPNYTGPTSFAGTSTAYLSVDSSGNVLTSDPISGYTGIVTINSMPPVNFDIRNGLIVNVF